MMRCLVLDMAAPGPQAGAVPWAGCAAAASFWNLIPVLEGGTIVLSLGYEWFGVPALLPSLGLSSTLFISVSGLCLVLLGITMVDQGEGRSTAVV